MKFSELSDSAKRKAIDKLSDGWLDYEWWDSVYDDAKRAGKILGLEVDEIFFSGFWSQGDGASFTGSYRYKQRSALGIAAYAPQDAELQRIARALQELQRRHFYRLRATVRAGRGHYVNVDAEDSENPYRNIRDAEGDLRELMADFAAWIYKNLEDEYEYLTSDEVMIDSIDANDYTFDEEGNLE